MKIGASGLAGIITAGWAPAILSAPRNPSVLFITIDALRADHLGCYGYHRNTSPNIDGFAKRSILFKNFFAVCPKTRPSLASFFTGKYIQNHGLLNNQSAWEHSLESFVQLLPTGCKKGAFVCSPQLIGLRGYPGFGKGGNRFTRQKDITKLAIKWLKENGKDSEFFLWLHYIDPHGPYKPPARFRKAFLDDQYYDASKTVPLDYEPREGFGRNYVLGAVPQYIREGDIDIVDYYVAQYDSEIKYSDAEVGKLLKHLESHKLTESTIVIISADHGEGMGEDDYYFEHGMLVNEGSIRIPLLIAHPDVKEPLTINSLLQNTDLGPTILSELGLKFSGEIDGVPFADLYHERKPDLEKREFIYSRTPHEYWDFHETMRTRRKKLIRRNRGDDFRLYDIDGEKLTEKETLSAADTQLARAYSKTMDELAKGAVEPAPKTAVPKELEESLKALGYIN